MISMDRVKCFVHQDVLNDTMIYSNDMESLMDIDCWDIGLYGIIETQEGYVLYEIDFKYDDEPFVWRKFMHLKSFLGFYKYRKMRFMDDKAEKFIKDALKIMPCERQKSLTQKKIKK